MENEYGTKPIPHVLPPFEEHPDPVRAMMEGPIPAYRLAIKAKTTKKQAEYLLSEKGIAAKCRRPKRRKAILKALYEAFRELCAVRAWKLAHPSQD